jgi:hypothetical protein
VYDGSLRVRHLMSPHNFHVSFVRNADAPKSDGDDRRGGATGWNAWRKSQTKRKSQP